MKKKMTCRLGDSILEHSPEQKLELVVTLKVSQIDENKKYRDESPTNQCHQDIQLTAAAGSRPRLDLDARAAPLLQLDVFVDLFGNQIRQH